MHVRFPAEYLTVKTSTPVLASILTLTVFPLDIIHISSTRNMMYVWSSSVQRVVVCRLFERVCTSQEVAGVQVLQP